VTSYSHPAITICVLTVLIFVLMGVLGCLLGRYRRSHPSPKPRPPRSAAPERAIAEVIDWQPFTSDPLTISPPPNEEQ